MYSLQWIKIQRYKCTAYNELKYRDTNVQPTMN